MCCSCIVDKKSRTFSELAIFYFTSRYSGIILALYFTFSKLKFYTRLQEFKKYLCVLFRKQRLGNSACRLYVSPKLARMIFHLCPWTSASEIGS